MKRILLVLDAFYPSVDGPINVIVNIAKISKELGIADVELLVPEYPKIVEIDGIVIHRCKSMPSADGYRMAVPAVDKNIKNIIKNGNYDLININSPFTLCKYAINQAKKYNIPTVFTLHTNYKSDFSRVLKHKPLINVMMNYMMKTIKKCDYVTTVSNGSSKMLQEWGYSGDITVIRNGTDMQPKEVSKELKQELIDKYGTKDKFIFLFVGRIVEYKNIQFTLKVLEKIKSKGYNDFKFFIVGSGSYIDDLKNLVEEYDLVENVVFFGKVSDREYLAGIYAISDLFMFPSIADTCGIVAIEAAANYLPSVMIENTCASEVIENKVNGMALPEDVDVWVEEIISVINDKKCIDNMRTNAYNTVYVSYESVVRQYIEFYEKIINSNK